MPDRDVVLVQHLHALVEQVALQQVSELDLAEADVLEVDRVDVQADPASVAPLPPAPLLPGAVQGGPDPNAAAVSGQGEASDSSGVEGDRDDEEEPGTRPRRNRRRRRSKRRQRRLPYVMSEESLSPVDDEAPFPSRISPRNRKPFQGYTKF